MAESTEEHARHRLDDALNSPIRFSLLASLATVDEAVFGHVRDRIDVSDSTLSKQSSYLEEVGYVAIRKGHVGKRPRTWLSITSDGRQALARHVDALRAIVDGT